MRDRFRRAVLRAVAVLIAIAALIDPVMSMRSTSSAPVSVVNMTANAANAADDIFRSRLANTPLTIREPLAGRIACSPSERCIVFADGSMDAAWPSGLRVPASLVLTSQPAGPNVAIRSMTVAAGQHRAAAGVARIALEGRGVSGRQTDLRLLDGDAIVGSASHSWQADGEITIDVPWWPIAGGPRVIRAEAALARDESAAFDNAVDAGVTVSSDRATVLVFDARPSWGSTFVRRALEADPRFRVEHRARLAPAISTGTANGRLDAQALRGAAALIVGAPDALTASDVDTVLHFVRQDGGTAILLPERAPSGPVAQLFTGRWGERLMPDPESIGPLRAGEILQPDSTALTATALARRQTGAASVVATPTGNGQIIVSGAMDAWRYRDRDAGAFDRFWCSLVAEAAAVSAPLQLVFDRDVAAAGTRLGFTLRSRVTDPRTPISASAVARCGDGPAQAIRLWPAGGPATFRGEWPIAEAGPCTIEAALGSNRVTGGVAVTAAPKRAAPATIARLEREARSAGGIVTTIDDLSPIATAIAQESGQEKSEPVHPMRSAWWIVPFAGCLSIEWWLRRRNGLR